MNDLNIKAISYCGTRPSGGVCQFEILKREGIQCNSKLLEIGCGPLMMGIPAMTYLDIGNYYAIEPNTWIINQTMTIEENKNIINARNPHIISNLDFDASSFDVKFDYIYAHSIMSHASKNQLPEFLQRTSDVLTIGGKLIFSLRLTEPNKYGNEGNENETNSDSWVYPGCSFFKYETVYKHAIKYYKSIIQALEYTELLTNNCKGVCHDWIICTK